MPSSTIASGILLRTFIVVTGLVTLTACSFDLDDPLGVKARRADERHADCEQVYEVTRASYEQSSAVYDPTNYVGPTQSGYLERSEIYLDTAHSLDALQLGDENLTLLKEYLAASFRHDAEVSRDLAPFAEAERSITSVNDLSEAHQAVLAREDPYNGLEYAIEVYCEGGDMPPPPLWSD